MSPQVEDLLNNSFKLRQSLSQVMPVQAVDYFMQLMAKDQAHKKLLKFVEQHLTQ